MNKGPFGGVLPVTCQQLSFNQEAHGVWLNSGKQAGAQVIGGTQSAFWMSQAESRWNTDRQID